jgi:RNA polymerase sigma-70 factor (ECF subfamily)
VGDVAEAGKSGDAELVERLCGGEEEAFAELVRLYEPGLCRMARLYVGPDTAEDVVQDTWTAVVRGIAGFEQRSTLRTWVFGILINIARRRAERDARTVPFAASGGHGDPWEGTVDPARLHHPDLGPGYWPASPRWAHDPADAAMAGETRKVILGAIEDLVPAQREVITLRDLEGWSGPEVCEVLGISGVNQRTLLHRARVAVRRALEEYFDG